MTRADFQSNGIFPLSIEIWKRWAKPGANSSVASFSSLPGMLSGPVALWGLMSFRSVRTPLMLTFMGCTLGVRLCPRSGSSDMSSWAKAERNWSPMMLALLRMSEKVSPSFFKGATPGLSYLRDLMKFQIALDSCCRSSACRLCNCHVFLKCAGIDAFQNSFVRPVTSCWMKLYENLRSSKVHNNVETNAIYYLFCRLSLAHRNTTF